MPPMPSGGYCPKCSGPCVGTKHMRSCVRCGWRTEATGKESAAELAAHGIMLVDALSAP